MPTTKTTRAIGEMMMMMSKVSSTQNKTNDRREERKRERERRLTAYTHLYLDWLAEGNELGWFFALLRIEDCAHDVRERVPPPIPLSTTSRSSSPHTNFPHLVVSCCCRSAERKMSAHGRKNSGRKHQSACHHNQKNEVGRAVTKNRQCHVYIPTYTSNRRTCGPFRTRSGKHKSLFL
jgi:hypothetical protein